MKFLTTYERLKFSLKNKFIVDISCQKENHLAGFTCGSMLVFCILSTVSYEGLAEMTSSLFGTGNAWPYIS